jgi:hypothetical protein
MYTLLIPEVEFWIEMSFLWVGQVCFNGDGQGARIIVFSIYEDEDFYSHSGFLMRGFLITKSTGQKFLVYLQVMLQSAKICGSFGKGVGGLFSFPVIPIR